MMRESWFNVLLNEAAEYQINAATAEIENKSKKTWKKQIKTKIEKALVQRILDQKTTKMQSCRCPGRDKRRNESDWAMLVFFGRAVSNHCVRRGKMLEGKPF